MIASATDGATPPPVRFLPTPAPITGDSRPAFSLHTDFFRPPPLPVPPSAGRPASTPATATSNAETTGTSWPIAQHQRTTCEAWSETTKQQPTHQPAPYIANGHGTNHPQRGRPTGRTHWGGGGFKVRRFGFPNDGGSYILVSTKSAFRHERVSRPRQLYAVFALLVRSLVRKLVRTESTHFHAHFPRTTPFGESTP